MIQKKTFEVNTMDIDSVVVELADGKVVVAVGKDRSAVTATVSIYYVVN